MRHELKTWREPFDAVERGEKRHEIRVDDREPPYATGDELLLQLYDPEKKIYLRREILVQVTHITRAPFVPAGLCVMSILHKTQPLGAVPSEAWYCGCDFCSTTRQRQKQESEDRYDEGYRAGRAYTLRNVIEDALEEAGGVLRREMRTIALTLVAEHEPSQPDEDTKAAGASAASARTADCGLRTAD